MASMSCSLPSVLAPQSFLSVAVAPGNDRSEELSLWLDVLRSERGLRFPLLSSSRLNLRKTRWWMPNLFLLLLLLLLLLPPSVEESDVMEPRRSSMVMEFSEDGILSWLVNLRSPDKVVALLEWRLLCWCWGDIAELCSSESLDDAVVKKMFDQKVS